MKTKNTKQTMEERSKMKDFFLKTITFLFLSLLVTFPGQVNAGDLDDGISKYKEESISGDDEIGDADVNVNFIVVDAIAKSKRSENEKDSANTPTQININSVICEVGATCGDINNVSD